MITTISTKTGISEEMILGKTRIYVVVTVRQLYYKLLREKMGYPFARIGELCNRDHSTIVNGLKHVNDLLEVGDGYAVSMWDKMKGIES